MVILKPFADSEAVAKALFQLALNVNSPAVPFNVMSRRMRLFKDVQSQELPAFFQFQSPERSTHGGVRGLPVEEIGFNWFVYLPKSQGLNDVVSPALNQYYDVLSNALLPPNGNVQSKNTLGGLVTNCYKDGRGLTDEGLLDTYSLIMIPIKVLVGM